MHFNRYSLSGHVKNEIFYDSFYSENDWNIFLTLKYEHVVQFIVFVLDERMWLLTGIVIFSVVTGVVESKLTCLSTLELFIIVISENQLLEVPTHNRVVDIKIQQTKSLYAYIYKKISNQLAKIAFTVHKSKNVKNLRGEKLSFCASQNKSQFYDLTLAITSGFCCKYAYN